MQDPFAVLGLKPDAGANEIKAAYRSLVKRWHPDSHGDDPAARERFLEISEAYAALTRTGKPAETTRSAERRRHRREQARAGATVTAAHPNGEQPSDDEMMERIFGVTPPRAEVHDAPGLEPEIGGENNETDAAGDGETGTAPQPAARRRSLHVALNALFSRRRGSGGSTLEDGVNEAAGAPDIVIAVVPLTVILTGGSIDVATEGGKPVPVPIEPGTPDGTIVQLPAAAEHAAVTVIVRHAFSDILWSSGTDVHLALAVDLQTAVLGGVRTCETLDGRIRITIPRWSTAETVLKVGARGLPGPDGNRGDLLVHLRIVLDATPDQRLVDLMTAHRYGFYV